MWLQRRSDDGAKFLSKILQSLPWNSDADFEFELEFPTAVVIVNKTSLLHLRTQTIQFKSLSARQLKNTKSLKILQGTNQKIFGGNT